MGACNYRVWQNTKTEGHQRHFEGYWRRCVNNVVFGYVVDIKIIEPATMFSNSSPPTNFYVHVIDEEDRKVALKLLFRLLCVQPKKSDVQNDFNFVFAQHEVTFRIHTVNGINASPVCYYSPSNRPCMFTY